MKIKYQVSFYNVEKEKREMYMNRTEMDYESAKVEVRLLKTDQLKREHVQKLAPNRSEFQLEVSGVRKCPFCSSINISFISDTDPGERDKEYLVCMNDDCLCEGPAGSDREEAFEKWDKRS